MRFATIAFIGKEDGVTIEQLDRVPTLYPDGQFTCFDRFDQHRDTLHKVGHIPTHNGLRSRRVELRSPDGKLWAAAEAKKK